MNNKFCCRYWSQCQPVTTDVKLQHKMVNESETYSQSGILFNNQ